MEKKQFVSSTLDATAVKLLTAIADAETEGNRSQALRKLVREGAERRGIAAAVAGQPAGR